MSWIKKSMLIVGLACCGQAQLKSVDIRVSGLDCASCAESIEKRLKRVRGVESASLDAATSTVRIVFAAENTAKLEVIQDALKGLGYTPGDATVELVGTIAADRVNLPHQQDAFILDRAEQSSGRARIKGTVKAGTRELRVQSIARN
jgi:cation transport ATPase